MPSYPDSVFAPANRSNGQTIDASHMNGVQDEVVAIEGGIINGTARVNSSNLNVTGASSFASRPVEPPPNVVKLGIDNAFEIASGSTGSPSWTRQDIATNSSMASTATNPTRVTPQTTGVYLCIANIYFENAAAGQQFVNIEDSSGSIFAHGQSLPTTGLRSVNVSGVKRIDSLTGSTQWMRVVAGTQTSSNRLSTIYTQFEVIKL